MASQPVPDPLLQEVLRYCQLPQQKPRDHKELRECVNKHSIFAGRNPLEVAVLKEEDISHTATATQLPTAAAGVSGSLSRTLTVNDLVDVLAVIHDLNRWKELGLQLGLLYPSLERIDHEQRGRISGCKIDMLSAWLQQQDNVSQRGVPSWSTLRAALLRMGENETANRIRDC